MNNAEFIKFLKQNKTQIDAIKDAIPLYRLQKYQKDYEQFCRSDADFKDSTIGFTLSLYLEVVKEICTGRELESTVSEEELIDCGQIFCKMINSVYGRTDKEFYLSEYFISKKEVLVTFEYSLKNLVKEPVILSEIPQGFSILHIYNFRDKRQYYFPNQYKFWNGATAIASADIYFSELIKNGY